MGILKFLARKGNIGQTARFVSFAFSYAIMNQLIDLENCQTDEGLKVELKKIQLHLGNFSTLTTCFLMSETSSILKFTELKSFLKRLL